jgi:hypothetical protein
MSVRPKKIQFMPVLILADQTDGHFKKTALEALSY